MKPNPEVVHSIRGTTSEDIVAEHVVPSPCAFIDRSVPPTEVVRLAMDTLLELCADTRRELGGAKHLTGPAARYAEDKFHVLAAAREEVGRQLAVAMIRDAAVNLCTMPEGDLG